MASRIVRKGFTVHYKHRAYSGGAEIPFEKDEDSKPFEHQLEAEGFQPKDTTEWQDDHESTTGDAFQHASGDTQSTDTKRQISESVHEGVRDGDKADYDARMTAISQKLAEQAHGVKPKGEFPQLGKNQPIPTVELPKEGRGAPLLANSPDDAPTEDAPIEHRRPKKPTRKVGEEEDK